MIDAIVFQDVFGRMPDGRLVERVQLQAADGVAVSIITYGAAVQALLVPDRTGQQADVVLGYDTLDRYLARREFFGATIGRYANRIAGAAFTLDGIAHRLTANDGRSCLHGGETGFDRALWCIEAVGAEPEPFITLRYVSPDGEGGFPGTVTARTTYRLSAPMELSITFEAITDRATMFGMTHHGFFNLGGVERLDSVLDHELTLFADAFLPTDRELIPLGASVPVDGTPFDFRVQHAIGARIRETDGQLQSARGYDHCFLLTGAHAVEPHLAARVVHPGSGRAMEILTDQPGIQFYSGNFLDGSAQGKYGRHYRQCDALCLEPQALPDAPNRPDFPSARLDPGSIYRHSSILRFSAA